MPTIAGANVELNETKNILYNNPEPTFSSETKTTITFFN
jgi:hypothetical protein